MHLPIAVVGFVAAFGLVRADGLEGVLARCCALGSDWARQRSYASCADFPPPVSSVPGEQLATCIASADICCRRDNRNTQCRRGSNAALADKRCSVDVAEHGEAYKDCCEACKLGMISGSLWQSCELKRFSFGLPWDAAFHECCAAASGTSSAATPPTSSNELLPPAANETLCSTMGRDLCAHVCVPTPGSYRCECHPGFGLMADGKSCKLLSGGPDRCKEENPCTHICRDTGLAVECSCRPGYALQSDRKTCKDIDECQAGTHHCLLKTQTCRNDPGGYTCLGKDGVIIVPRVFEALDNALAPVGPGPQPGPGCPAGYQFNAQLAVCDDVDECASGLADCGRPEDCVNTVGSYRCDGSAQGACPPGYVWEEAAQRCVDQDECEDGSNNCAEETQFCLNSQGGFACLERVQGRGSCPAGYKKDTTHRSGCKGESVRRERAFRQIVFKFLKYASLVVESPFNGVLF
ncbi:fibulin-2-like isoform X2 [Frankliniella occidentalis]|uniref:Fibulin-2-like isoform X2 n=1 Tax=Frankliniella occidentalis TaxID=133901 RepID=A0A9C6UAF9_FRAOC|nr:fibulin-2-like isoform X2 [Frankliniella occidentalis]